MPQGARNNISDKLDRKQTTQTLCKCSALGRCCYSCCHAMSSKVENKMMFFCELDQSRVCFRVRSDLQEDLLE